MKKIEKIGLGSFVALFFTAALFVISGTENSFGGGDSISHYKIAHWAWKHPGLLLDHWGKPVFTLLISPWAQFGMNGARAYNVFMGLMTSVLIWKMSDRFHIKSRWLGPVLVIFVPLYFVSMFSSLTAVTFSFFLVLGLYLFFLEKWIGSAMVLSFLPLVRTEGIVLFALFVTAYVLKKQFRALLFLLTGLLVFSIAGFFYYHDVLWIIHQNPYSGEAAAIYGHGHLFHFVLKMPWILGYPMVVLFVLGLLILVIRWVKHDSLKTTNTFYFLWLVPGSFLLYLAAHSYVWWRGMGNSLGLIRVMAAVTPLASLTALVALDVFLRKFPKIPSSIKWMCLAGLMAWVVEVGLITYPVNFHPSSTEKLMNRAVDFLHQSKLDRHKVYYFDPYLAYKLGIDPYSDKISQWYPAGSDPVAQLPPGAVIVWDAHFGPNEGRAPLSLLLNNNKLQLVKIFRPKEPFKVLGGYDYAVYIFQKR